MYTEQSICSNGSISVGRFFITDDKSDLLNPMGTVERNPNVDSAAGLLIRFANIRPYPLYYPPLDKVRGCRFFWCVF